MSRTLLLVRLCRARAVAQCRNSRRAPAPGGRAGDARELAAGRFTRDDLGSVAHSALTARGSTPAGASNAILRFDPATGAVSRAGTLPEHVADGGIATIGDTPYVVGGISGAPLMTVCIVRIG